MVGGGCRSGGGGGGGAGPVPSAKRNVPFALNTSTRSLPVSATADGPMTALDRDMVTPAGSEKLP